MRGEPRSQHSAVTHPSTNRAQPLTLLNFKQKSNALCTRPTYCVYMYRLTRSFLWYCRAPQPGDGSSTSGDGLQLSSSGSSTTTVTNPILSPSGSASPTFTSSSTPHPEVPPAHPCDIGLVASGNVAIDCITDSERYQYLTQECKTTKFATRDVMKTGKRIQLNFQESWLKEFQWLSYSPTHGGGYCKYCVLFAKLTTGGMLGTLVKTPFRNFSKAKGKDGYLTTRNIADYHHDAVQRGKSFIKTFTNPDTRIDSLLDAEHQAQSDENKHILSVIVDSVKLCGMQGIPLRGHRDDYTADPLTNN